VGLGGEHAQLPVPPETTVADFDVELGAVVAVVGATATEVPEVPDTALADVSEDELVVDVVEGVVLAAVRADTEVVIPGISGATTRPKAEAAPMARTATALDVRRDRASAPSRRARPSFTCLGGETLMVGMSPRESQDPRTAG